MPFGTKNGAMVYDYGKGEYFVVSDASKISVISDRTHTVVANITNPGFGFSDSLAYDSEKGEIFVTAGNSVVVISDKTNAIIANIPFNFPLSSGTLKDLVYDSGKGEVFVITPDSRISIISDANNEIIKNLDITGTNLLYDSGKGEIFASGSETISDDNTLTNKQVSWVSVISDSTNSVVATIPVENASGEMVYDSGRGEVFVATGNPFIPIGNAVAVISDSTNKVVATIPVAAAALAYKPLKGEVIAASFWGNSTSVISDQTNSVVATVPVGTFPNGVLYNSGTDEILVSYGTSANISVLSDSAVTSPSSSPTGTTVLSPSASSAVQNGSPSPSPSIPEIAGYLVAAVVLVTVLLLVAIKKTFKKSTMRAVVPSGA